MEAPVANSRVRTVVAALDASVAQGMRRKLNDDVLLEDGPSTHNRAERKEERRKAFLFLSAIR